MIAQSKLVSHDAIFLVPCLTTLENEICCKLQKSCYTAMVPKICMQSLHKVELIYNLDIRCKPKKVTTRSELASIR